MFGLGKSVNDLSSPVGDVVQETLIAIFKNNFVLKNYDGGCLSSKITLEPIDDCFQEDCVEGVVVEQMTVSTT